jgi:hypothetical protein
MKRKGRRKSCKDTSQLLKDVGGVPSFSYFREFLHGFRELDFLLLHDNLHQYGLNTLRDSGGPTCKELDTQVNG